MIAAEFVSYARVSTDRQGRSGLGLEAQRTAVTQFVEQRGGTVISEYVEVESGKRNDRPELAKALAECRRRKAVLVIAKLDRLARNVALVANLMESRVEFVCCDMPDANRLTLHILASVAEHEREMISQRTKAALAAAKARGTLLGANGKNLGARKIAEAEAFAAHMAPVIDGLRAEGFTTIRALMGEMNRRAIPSARGGQWHEMTVSRLLGRIASKHRFSGRDMADRSMA